MYNVTINLKNSLHNSICVLPISVGQSYHENEIFEKTVEAINRKFSKCIIVIADTLQRHTYELKGLSKSEAMLVSRSKGAEWLVHNQSNLDKFTIEIEVMYWDQWLEHDSYIAQKADIDRRYAHGEGQLVGPDREFRTAVNRASAKFIAGYLNENCKKNFEINFANKMCREYILEEAAVISIFSEHNYDYMAYPLRHNSTNQEIFDCVQNFCLEGRMKLLNIQITKVPEKQPKSKQPKTHLFAIEPKRVIPTQEQLENIKNLTNTVDRTFSAHVYSMLPMIPSELHIVFLIRVSQRVTFVFKQLEQRLRGNQARLFTHQSLPMQLTYVSASEKNDDSVPSNDVALLDRQPDF